MPQPETLKVGAGCPIRVAIACSFCARRISHIDRLRAGVFQLGLGLRDVNRRGHSALVPALRQLQGFFERGHIRLQQLLFRIERPHLEVVESQLGMQTQTHGFQVPGAGLRICTRGFNRVAHSSKHVRLRRRHPLESPGRSH